MARTEISSSFYKLVECSVRRQILTRLQREMSELAEKIVADEVAKFSIAVEEMISIEAGGHELRITIVREEKKP